MNSIVYTNAFRFIILILVQVFILQYLPLSLEGPLTPYFHIIIYPLFILLLPYDMRPAIVLLIAFLMGIIIDMFYNSLGVHAAALVMTAAFRPTLLRFQEPKGGFPAGQSPTRYRLGTLKYIYYTLALISIHIVWYYSMVYFSIVYIKEIIYHSVVSIVLSMVLILIQSFIFNTKN